MNDTDTLPVCRSMEKAGTWFEAQGTISLSYEARFLRRRRLVAADGRSFLVDLPHATSVGAGDAFMLDTGDRIAVEAAEEPLYAVEGDLVRLAWHIGNRHTPCQIDGARLLIARDHVLRDMLLRLGATVTEVEAPFMPEGGAYGHGRTMGHDHGPSVPHTHSHSDGSADHPHGVDQPADHGHLHNPAQAHGHPASHGHGDQKTFGFGTGGHDGGGGHSRQRDNGGRASSGDTERRPEHDAG